MQGCCIKDANIGVIYLYATKLQKNIEDISVIRNGGNQKILKINSQSIPNKIKLMLLCISKCFDGDMFSIFKTHLANSQILT